MDFESPHIEVLINAEDLVISLAHREDSIIAVLKDSGWRVSWVISVGNNLYRTSMILIINYEILTLVWDSCVACSNQTSTRNSRSSSLSISESFNWDLIFHLEQEHRSFRFSLIHKGNRKKMGLADFFEWNSQRINPCLTFPLLGDESLLRRVREQSQYMNYVLRLVIQRHVAKIDFIELLYFLIEVSVLLRYIFIEVIVFSVVWLKLMVLT